MLQDPLEQLDLFDWFKDIVDSSIHDCIMNKINHTSLDPFDYNKIDFYPVYTACPKTKEKVLKTIKIRNRDQEIEYMDLTLNEIEVTGAAWHEFLDFLIFSDAVFVNYKQIM